MKILKKNYTKTNKYHNKKVEFEGIKFDSKKEALRYKELKYLAEKGLIKNLELQKMFELLPKYDINGRHVRAITYTCDFYYYDTIKNLFVVEDVKGMKTDVYKIKKKMFEYKYQIEIKEV
jgi:hypothetical protein|nr:MAG TPA_asm: Endonuclease [Caudoviricetes sp.]